jgi:hypothetical protein
MVGRFKDTEDADTAFFTAWTCALKRDAVPDYAPVLRLAEKALADQPNLTRFEMAAGAVLCRMGRHAEAHRHLLRTLPVSNPEGIVSPAYWSFFLAMAKHGMSDSTTARTFLEMAVAKTEEEQRRLAQDAEPSMWVRKPTLQLLRAETEALLRGGPAKQEK